MTAYFFAAFFFALGLAVGVLFLLLLKRTVRLFVDGGSAWRAGAFYLARFALAGLAFFWAAHAGVVALLAAVCGFTLARVFAVRRGSVQDD